MKRAVSNNSAAASAVKSGSRPLHVERALRERKIDEVERRERSGKFGIYGGKFVPETLISCLGKLEADFNFVLHDAEFQDEKRNIIFYYFPALFSFDHLFRRSWLLPEERDLNHCGAHKMNNAIAQAMIAKRMGRQRVVAATGAGQHGVATAAVCAKLSLDCIIFLGSEDMEKQASNVFLIKLLGAQMTRVEGSFNDASSEAIRQWMNDLEGSYYLTGTVVGPRPCPCMVREFQSIIGRETRRLAMKRWGGWPDAVVACIGSGSNALGIFHEFVGDEGVRLVGVEAAGSGLDSGRHAATLATGHVGVYHGAMSYLLQDQEGQVLGAHSVGVGLHYPGVGPELSFLEDTTSRIPYRHRRRSSERIPIAI
ncbi:tryptophan synthase beta chain 2, chloroplastic-like [Eucalyptus grandis]|uniref:tryptophan synthase beta chain 2, chloroplastic-like n=1 Tax=Eucalyptus grandis TaxID=71139 RepID=UPI00192EB891|nr:tryptophan synthase beta chain 2, chloroplastic-like [Eucalyptus grandis]